VNQGAKLGDISLNTKQIAKRFLDIFERNGIKTMNLLEEKQ
jgi:hypothetical protein